MSAAEKQADYVKQVFATLQSNPTAASLDFLVAAFANIGYLASTAETDAEMAEAQRKFDEASEAGRVRQDAAERGVKLTADVVAATVAVNTFLSKKDEIKAWEKARKLKNLLESIEQAVNAIKFLGRYDSSINAGDKVPGR